MSAWSKRRAAVAAEERAEAAARDAALRQAEEEALAARPDEELLAEAGVSAPEDLTCAEEVREFLKLALPERLKRRALRRLWGLNPVLANVDGLVDYGEDFTDKAMCVENLKTVYTVGKGMLEQFKAMEDEPEVAEETTASHTSAGADDDGESPEQDQVADSDAAEVAPEVPQEQVRDDAEAMNDDPGAFSTPGQRRMRFTFEGA